MSGLRSVEAKYSLDPKELEEIMNDDWDDLFADWKYVAGALVGFGVGVLLVVLLFLFVGV